MTIEKPMLFKELAAMFQVSENTLRKWIKNSENEAVRSIPAKRGSGTYFYNANEVQILIKNLKYILT